MTTTILSLLSLTALAFAIVVLVIIHKYERMMDRVSEDLRLQNELLADAIKENDRDT
jgi:hypothetical protein